MGPVLRVEWFLLVIVLTPTPSLGQDDNQPCRNACCTVESSWCTEHRNLPYSCHQSNLTAGIPYNGNVTITERNLTRADLTVENKYVVNISLWLRNTTVWTEAWVNRMVRLRPPQNFYFVKVHVAATSVRISSEIVGFSLTYSRQQPDSVWKNTSTPGYDIFEGRYQFFWGTHSTSIPSQDFRLLPNSGLDLNIKLLGSASVNISTSFLFETAFNPASQLQVYCDAQNKGHIQTPGWNRQDHYSLDARSCVTLNVPDDHTVMVSLVDLDIAELQDTLILYTEAGCKGPRQAIEELNDFQPTLYSTKAISLLFISNDVAAYSGFRFLYSFHPNSTQPPKLTNGKWNCSVTYFQDFKQHFMCSARVFCSDEQDAVTGCRKEELCGVPGNVDQWERDGYCYRVIRPREKHSWLESAKKCENLGGHLIHLNSESKRSFFWNLKNVTKLDTEIIYVGLKLSAVSIHGMYKYTRVWSDHTLAVFLTMHNDTSVENCAYADLNAHNVIRGTPCNEKKRVSIVCEDVGGRGKYHVGRNATPPLLARTPATAALPDGMEQCNQGQMAHSFLACDVDTNCFAVDFESSEVCVKNIKVSKSALFFHCRGGAQIVPNSLVCDHRSDCCDSSDEDFCQFPDCDEDEFVCMKTKQCIRPEQRCDRHIDCLDDGSDESGCDSTQTDIQNNDVLPPAKVDFTGLGDFIVTPLNSSRCPDTHFRCPGNGTYCMPAYVRCNGVYDCPGKEDEADCDVYTCPGFYRCRLSRVCLHHEHLCDGTDQCPQGDDELMCNVTCPDPCRCYGHAFICRGQFSPALYPDLRSLVASGTGMTLSSVSSNIFLIHLDLQRCGIATIGTLNLPNLHSLDLSFNELDSVTGAQIAQLNNLRYVSLGHNPLVSLHDVLHSPRPLSHLIGVDFVSLRIPEWHDNFSYALPSVRYVNLSGSGLDMLSKSGFQRLKQLRWLDLRGCPVRTFSRDVFADLSELNAVYTDNYKLCCPSVLPPGADFECKAQINEVSSCDALLRTGAFRVLLTIYALLSLLGNLGSFVYRTFVDKKVIKMGFDIFVTHLCVADFLMGVYLAVIGVADRMYYGNYVWKDVTWRHSTSCKVAGFLSLLSSEVSAFLICLITLERLLVLRFPLRNLRFRKWSAQVACVSVWLVGLLLASIPLLPRTQHWDFYGQTGICIPLPITRQDFPGVHYAFGVVVGLNFVLFVLIAAGQLLIYLSVRANSMSAKHTSRKSNDTAVARRLLAVVMTDFLCWFPIGLLGILARLHVAIPGEVNVIMAVIVLPFNSALNPFLYTFNMLMERRHKHRSSQPTEMPEALGASKSLSIKLTEIKSIVCTEEDAWKLFHSLLDEGLLSLDRVRHHATGTDHGHM